MPTLGRDQSPGGPAAASFPHRLGERSLADAAQPSWARGRLRLPTPQAGIEGSSPSPGCPPPAATASPDHGFLGGRCGCPLPLFTSSAVAVDAIPAHSRSPCSLKRSPSDLSLSSRAFFSAQRCSAGHREQGGRPANLKETPAPSPAPPQLAPPARAAAKRRSPWPRGRGAPAQGPRRGRPTSSLSITGGIFGQPKPNRGSTVAAAIAAPGRIRFPSGPKAAPPSSSGGVIAGQGCRPPAGSCRRPSTSKRPASCPSGDGLASSP